jgi:hypothetical protein
MKKLKTLTKKQGKTEIKKRMTNLKRQLRVED